MKINNYLLPKEKCEERMAICRTCEHFIESTVMCNKCFCYLPWKVNLAPACCPEHKWLNVLMPDKNIK